MNCPNCGAALGDEFVKFCPKCGTKLQNNSDISKEFRLRKALAPELDYDTKDADKILMTVKINDIPINFNYEKSMYIALRRPIDLHRSEWKADLVKYIIDKEKTINSFKFNHFKVETIPYFNEGKKDFTYWVINHIKDTILNSSHFIRSNYRETIEEKINYSSISSYVGDFAIERLMNYIEIERLRPREKTLEPYRHSKIFSSPGGFGVWNTIKGTLVAEALNYSIDAAGFLYDYVGKVKDNFKTNDAYGQQVPFYESLVLLACDCAADRIANYAVKQCMDLCKLNSIDSTNYIKEKEFNDLFLAKTGKHDSKILSDIPDKTYAEVACQVLAENPYNFAVLSWLYNLNPSFGDTLIKYGEFLNIQDIVENMINDIELNRLFNKYYSNPFLDGNRNYVMDYFKEKIISKSF